MSNFETIRKAWLTSAAELANEPWFQRLEKGSLEIKHYKGFLRETYHHAGLNPQIQAYTTMFFRNNPRNIIGMFYSHAKSEIGHDLLALEDLKNLGEDGDGVVKSRPLPSTVALNAFVLYSVQFLNPLAYLGYLFHLEFLPTLNGNDYQKSLKKIGVPENALSFLAEHSTVDIGHNKLMEKYIEQLIETKKDLDDVIYAAQTTCHLHRNMICDAFAYGEKHY